MGRVRKVSVRDGARLLAGVVAPMLAQGVIRRRPAMVALTEKLRLDARAVRLLGRMRRAYGGGPVQLPLPLRPIVFPLSPEDVVRVLDGSPEPFAVANREKRAALAHFGPDVLLISPNELRAERRRFNEEVLATGRAMHPLAGALAAKVREEAGALLDGDTLTWADFAAVWWRAVRRVVLGDGARDDEELTRLLARLRDDANWAYLRPRREAAYARFTGLLRAHLDRAEPGSLAGMLADLPVPAHVRPAGQVPHWLFAFDAAGIAAYRALALLATHPGHLARARAESRAAAGVAAEPGGGTFAAAAMAAAPPPERPFLRACVLESVRLWPTTLAILRDSTSETTWDGAAVPAGTPFLVFSSFVNRDRDADPFADRFAPEIWLDGAAAERRSIVPFSTGPARCAGRELVLMLTAELLATLLERHEHTLVSPPALSPDRPLPHSLNPFALRFRQGDLTSG
ncbi:cytochrome P450 [Thermocatellispora tengchongensis]|uniref:Cytochrome P450 n=1 Tax=Thermocatellispora tengchongensis TaxID=1073253 RepID=A0A840P9Y3_9ACTN|nr:cytochrome P450 [Thermocatellispora tengchongensis]MBB5136458.1 cytochrome P450 [Thermocatellispora tengchongensis]